MLLSNKTRVIIYVHLITAGSDTSNAIKFLFIAFIDFLAPYEIFRKKILNRAHLLYYLPNVKTIQVKDYHFTHFYINIQTRL
jgi:hypothetical protein